MVWYWKNQCADGYVRQALYQKPPAFQPESVRKAGDLVSGRYRECVIQGGNHAQFGDYGEQRGDGKATITAEDQQIQTIAEIRDFAIK